MENIQPSLSEELRREANRLSLKVLLTPGKLYTFEEAQRICKRAQELAK